MKQPDYYMAALLISILAFVIAAANYWRTGRWRDTDDGRDVVDRVDSVENRLTAVETKMQGLATKADVAGIQAEIRGLERTAERTQAGVGRIEQYLMDRTK